MPHCVFIINIVSHFTNFLNLPIATKKPRLFLTLVHSVLSDFHSHGEAACEEVIGVRLTCVWWNNVPCVRISVRLTLIWWRRGESPGAEASLAPDGSAPDTVCQDLPHRSSLKTVRRTVFLTLRPSRVRLPKLNGNTKRPPSGGLLHLANDPNFNTNAPPFRFRGCKLGLGGCKTKNRTGKKARFQLAIY